MFWRILEGDRIFVETFHSFPQFGMDKIYLDEILCNFVLVTALQERCSLEDHCADCYKIT
jgi:hypothetical protein